MVGGVAGLTFGGLVLELIEIEKTVYLNSLIYLMSAASLSLIVYKSKREMKREAQANILGKKIKEAFKTSFLYELKASSGCIADLDLRKLDADGNKLSLNTFFAISTFATSSL